MKKRYYAPVATTIDLRIEQNILLDLSSGTTMGGGSALGKQQQSGAWGDIWKK